MSHEEQAAIKARIVPLPIKVQVQYCFRLNLTQNLGGGEMAGEPCHHSQLVWNKLLPWGWGNPSLCRVEGILTQLWLPSSVAELTYREDPSPRVGPVWTPCPVLKHHQGTCGRMWNRKDAPCPLLTELCFSVRDGAAGKALNLHAADLGWIPSISHDL